MNRYQNKIMLHGVIFLYRISDIRMSGACRRSLQLFQAICGDSALCNAMIVTTMWDNVDLKDGLERETQLDEQFVRPFLKNTRMLRHNQRRESAHQIISTILRNEPRPLAIQVEMVTDNKLLLETRAGLQLSGDLQGAIQDLNRQIAASGVAERKLVSSKGGPGVVDDYLDDDDRFEREELLNQLDLYRGQMKSLEDESYTRGEEYYHIGHKLLRLCRRLIGRNRREQGNVTGRQGSNRY